MNKIFLTIILTLSIFINCSTTYSAYPEFVDSIDQAQQEALDQNKDLLLIFGADWCPHCVRLKKDIESSGDFLIENYVICYVEYDNNSDLAKKYSIDLIPYSILLKNNKVAKRIKGYGNFQSYSKLIK